MTKRELVRLVREMADKIEELTESDWSACPDSPDGDCHGQAAPSDDGFIRKVACTYCKHTLWTSNVKTPVTLTEVRV